MRFAGDQRGTASVEIMVMLPVFIVLFVASSYVRVVAEGAHDAAARTRGCVFQRALEGCTGAPASLCESSASGVPTRLDVESATPGVLGELAQWPVLGTALGVLFGESVSASYSREVPALGGGTNQVARTAAVVCNPVPVPWEKKLKDLACQVIAGRLGMCD